MNFTDAINFIKHPNLAKKENARWADLGCGSGMFTYALANMLQKGSSIMAVDKSPVKLAAHPNPNNIAIVSRQLDFIKQSLQENNLDGILMANSLHYVADKINFIKTIAKQLAADGMFLMIEYDTDRSNQWVPYPLNAAAMKQLFDQAGFHTILQYGKIASMYNAGSMYAAIIKR